MFPPSIKVRLQPASPGPETLGKLAQAIRKQSGVADSPDHRAAVSAPPYFALLWIQKSDNHGILIGYESIFADSCKAIILPGKQIYWDNRFSQYSHPPRTMKNVPPSSSTPVLQDNNIDASTKLVESLPSGSVPETEKLLHTQQDSSRKRMYELLAGVPFVSACIAAALAWWFLGRRADDMAGFIRNAGEEVRETAGEINPVTPPTGLTGGGSPIGSPGIGSLPSTPPTLSTAPAPTSKVSGEGSVVGDPGIGALPSLPPGGKNSKMRPLR